MSDDGSQEGGTTSTAEGNEEESTNTGDQKKWIYPFQVEDGSQETVDDNYFFFQVIAEDDETCLQYAIRSSLSHISVQRQIINEAFDIVMHKTHFLEKDKTMSKKRKEEEFDLCLQNLLYSERCFKAMLGTVPAFMFLAGLHSYLTFLGESFTDDRQLIEGVMAAMRRGLGETTTEFHLETNYNICLAPRVTIGSKFYETLDMDLAEGVIDRLRDLVKPEEKKWKTKKMQNKLGVTKELIESMLHEDQEVVDFIDPWKTIDNLKTSLAGLSHFIAFLRLLEANHYEGIFVFIEDINECTVFRRFGNFMLQFQSDLGHIGEQKQQLLVLERNLSVLRNIDLPIPPQVDLGLDDYFHGWCRPQDWATKLGTAQQGFAKKARSNPTKVNVNCPICKTLLIQTEERFNPIPKDNNGALDFDTDWDAEKHANIITALREHCIAYNRDRAREHAVLPFCARYKRVQVDYKGQTRAEKPAALRQRYSRALSKVKAEVEIIKRKAKPKQKIQEDLLQLAKDNGFA
jgi:hypothetical protein